MRRLSSAAGDTETQREETHRGKTRIEKTERKHVMSVYACMHGHSDRERERKRTDAESVQKGK